MPSLVTAEDDVLILDEESLPWISDSEAPKSGNNLIRIKFTENQKALSDEDENALVSMLNIIGDANQKVKITSYADGNMGDQRAREIAMQRTLNLREKLVKHGFNVDDAKFFVFGAESNKQNLDYIDIDKY